MPFIHDDFLLQSKAAQRLFHEYAEAEPILDYHTHLPPEDVVANRRFANLSDIWLEGDHYKWRAMRACGVEERFCTGEASPRDKFQVWAQTVPKTLRNPLYHWTHLELKRYFDIDQLLNEDTAEEIWQTANAKLQGDELSAHGILDKFDVRCVCTTDDPTDSLSHHRAIAKSDLKTKVYPTFRPDAALRINQPREFVGWLERLRDASDVDVGNHRDLLEALKQRHDAFHELGCRLSDHGLEYCYASACSDQEAERIFEKVLKSEPIDAKQHEQFATNLMLHFGVWDAEKGWTKQLHLGALRNNSPRMLALLGRDTGYDSIGDWPQAKTLSWYLGTLDAEGALPKTIIYNLNPADNYMVAAMIGNFQSSEIAGKVQMGSGWWFLDQQEGMTWQLNSLSNLGLLSNFVGMLTDSRSFMSYPRHEYFRRCICNLLGQEMEQGVLPNDMELVGDLVRRLCFSNARDYLGLEIE